MTHLFRAYLTRTSHFIQTTAFSHHLIEGANNAFIVEIAFQQSENVVRLPSIYPVLISHANLLAPR